MTTPLHEIEVGDPPVLLQKPRRFGVVGFLAGLIVIVGLSGLLWMNYDRLIEASSMRTAAAPATTDTAVETEAGVSLTDFQAFQQQVTQGWQSNGQAIEAQQAEMKRLSDQIAALTARIDQLQQPVTPVTPSRPAAPTAPRKQPTAAAAPRPPSGISLGGAPLPGTAPPTTRP